MTALAAHSLTIRSDQDDYLREVGTVRDWHIGMEDHGIFSFNVNFDFGGSGQGCGHYGLGSEKHGFVTVEFLWRLYGVLGAIHGWKGRECLVLRNEPYGQIIGIESMPNARDRKQVIFKEMWGEKPLQEKGQNLDS